MEGLPLIKQHVLSTNRAYNCAFMHSPNKWGENLAIANLAPGSIAQLWYTQEVCKYNFSNPGFSEATGHFTQVDANK